MSPRDAKSSEGTREQLDPNQVVKERPLESGIGNNKILYGMLEQDQSALLCLSLLGKNLASFEDLVEASLKKDRVVSSSKLCWCKQGVCTWTSNLCCSYAGLGS